MLRTIKIVLIVCVAAWGFLGAAHNLIDWRGTLDAVGAATSMATFEGGADRWQATTNGTVIWAGALMIMLLKVISACLCTVGVGKMWQARTGNSLDFHAAKDYALAGCGVAMILLFGGFVVIGESWFEMWRSDILRDLSLQSAFRYGAMITLIALFVGSREPDESR